MDRAAEIAADASLVSRALATAEVNQVKIDPMPIACSLTVRSGVQAGDRQDVALLKTDAALGRANAEKLECTALADRKINIANEGRVK